MQILINIYDVLVNPKDFFKNLNAANEDNNLQLLPAVWVLCIANATFFTLKYNFAQNGFGSYLPQMVLTCVGGVFLLYMAGAFFEFIAKIFNKSGKMKAIMCAFAYSTFPLVLFAPVQLLKPIGQIGYFSGVCLEIILYFWSIYLMATKSVLAQELEKQIARGKAGKTDCRNFKDSNLKLLRIMDQQTAVRRFKWTGLPKGINSVLMQRILYYRGQGIFFYLPELDQYKFLPYSPVDGIDVYGRAKGCTPLPFGGTSSTTVDGKQMPWIQGFKKIPVYEGQDIPDPKEACVIIRDYTQQRPQIIIPRQALNDPLLDVMADCVPFMRTALVNSTGVKGLRINSQEEYTSVLAANKSIQNAALTGQWAVPIIGNVEFQELTDGQTGKVQDFLLAMQGLQNYRLSTYGLPNGGVFEKKEHKLQAEQDQNSSNSSLVYKDSLEQRQEAADLINAVFGLSVGVEERVQPAPQETGFQYSEQEETDNDMQQ